MVRIFFLFFLVLYSPGMFVSYAQPVVISGTSPSYANTSFEFLKTTDWITGTEEVAGTCQVSENGDFRIEIPLGETEQLYLYMGIYRGFFYAEPGKSYRLVLPERQDKSPEDMLNPYFEPVEVHIGLSNFSNSDLNMLIMMFDDAYIPYYDKHVNNLYIKTDINRLEEDIRNIENPFRDYPGVFFRQYRQYHYGVLKLLANQQRVQSQSDEYFNDQPVQYNNPAYAGLFNQVYDKYFVFFGRSPEGSQIYADINQSGSYRALSATLSGTINFSNDTLKELIMLKQIHDEFYGNQFSRSGLIKILDSLMIETKIERHRYIGQNIRGKITRLQPGYEPPQFELQDTDGNLVKLSDFRGSYVYLNFCTCQSYACLNEFNMLTALYQKHKDHLVILTIATDPMEEILRQFLAKNKYDWKFLHYDNQPSVIRDYDIRAFPTYFLIGPDGKLIFSPADSPAENFEQKLFEAMRSRGDL
ncbi:MAG TPA: TlpA disulfide reductase family protein [Bacteroidales bacterium]|nr:TlpA disulfide reductase family protein [Bacteroidales bacterium]